MASGFRACVVVGMLLVPGAMTACTRAAANSGPECIAPANPGGGWDLTCRAAAATLEELDLVARPIRVTNVPGDGGAVAFAKAIKGGWKGDAPIVAASPSTVIGLTQRRYGDATERDVRWVATVGAEPSVIAVRADAPWRNFRELAVAWREGPEKIVVGGGSAIGGQDHMKALMLAEAIGVRPERVRYMAYNGGGEAAASLLADSIQIFPGDASEVQRHLLAGDVRVLAILSDRHAGGPLAGVPTAREEGFDVEWLVWRGFYASAAMPEEAYQRWVDDLDKMSHSTQWQSVLEQNGLIPYFMAGPEFSAFVYRQADTLRALSERMGIIRKGI